MNQNTILKIVNIILTIFELENWKFKKKVYASIGCKVYIVNYIFLFWK